MDLQAAHHELKKKLNIRKGNEEPFGLSTPGARKLFKPTSSEENQKKKGGAQVGMFAGCIIVSYSREG